jgi:hypothetical protein
MRKSAEAVGRLTGEAPSAELRSRIQSVTMASVHTSWSTWPPPQKSSS